MLLPSLQITHGLGHRIVCPVHVWIVRVGPGLGRRQLGLVMVEGLSGGMLVVLHGGDVMRVHAWSLMRGCWVLMSTVETRVVIGACGRVIVVGCCGLSCCCCVLHGAVVAIRWLLSIGWWLRWSLLVTLRMC